MKGKHLLIMALCCLVPLIALGAVWIFKVPLGTVGTVAVLLLCPVGHLVMMKFMGGHNHGDHKPQPGAQQSEVGTQSTGKGRSA